MAAALGIRARLLPATDERWRTTIETAEGRLAFQEYFVRLRQEPGVRGFGFEGSARPSPGVRAALADAELIVIGPSNPIVSIGPILALPEVRSSLESATAARVAVSPIIAGQALKGPAARMMGSLGHEVSALGVARLYAGLVDRFVIDVADAHLAAAIAELGMEPVVLPTIMRTDADRAALAAAICAGLA
jgi:LPPG:FO 2-phospho-L-lactate transferase